MGQANVKLRELRQADAFYLAQLANNKKVWDNVRDYFPHPYTESDAVAFLKSQNEKKQKNFAIECDGKFCGVIGLILQKDVYRKSAELGYWVGEPYWGRGIATKAVAQIVQYGFDELNLVRIFAGAFEYNVGSMRVLETNGFEKEGIAKKAVLKNEKFWDEHRYSKLKK
jgi:RimJ/RimL family protein N-acetyltransferase